MIIYDNHISKLILFTMILALKNFDKITLNTIFKILYSYSK